MIYIWFVFNIYLINILLIFELESLFYSVLEGIGKLQFGDFFMNSSDFEYAESATK